MTTPRSRLMAVLTVGAMLVIGVIGGIALDRGVLRRRPEGRMRGNGPFGLMSERVDTASRNRMRARIVKRIADDLALSPTQAHAVDSIFARRELQLDSLRARVGPQLDSLRDAMRLSIDAVLTPEQRVKFKEQTKRFDARRHDHDREGGPPRD